MYKRQVQYSLKPQLKTLGPKYGKQLGLVKKFLETCDAAAVVNAVKEGGVYKANFEGADFEFAAEALLISLSLIHI